MTECKTVTLRKRVLKNGLLSFYLDYYPGYRDMETMKTIYHEGLNIKIYAHPKNQREIDFNAEMTEKAEAIRCRRYADIVNERYDFFDKHRLKGDFLEFFRKQLPKHEQKWEFVYQHFNNFVHGKCRFDEIDLELCNRFKDYLLNAKKLKNKTPMSRNSAASYWASFRAILTILYRNKLLKTNLNEYLERISCVDTKLDYLSNDELSLLADTPCEIPVLKTASLFSCLTSLRISDILALKWEDIVDYSAGGKCVHILTQKTTTEDIIPIGDEALELIEYSPEKTGKVFKGLIRSMTGYQMKKWVASAGITKKITFHSFRRTFATLQAAAGTDIITISSCMAHKRVSTTQRYTKIVDENKRAASNRISLHKKD